MSVVNTKEQNVDVDTPKTKAVKILPKKRPYVPEIQTEEKHITHIMAIVTKQTEEVKEVIAGSQTEPLRNQSGVTDKKTQAPELAASDKTTAKPAREVKKRQCQKESTRRPLDHLVITHELFGQLVSVSQRFHHPSLFRESSRA
ncbi:unnamed protein product [Pieris macdunnoughi]|uniref:Uncharacterized protein n=1 Tax=Pieris macdunnoughi TaxID=345717 RepID=A0A821WNL7_9NEOP|nr:unnamed protein product [Pieris macdunnoughi]